MKTLGHAILAVNVGSSSIKFALYLIVNRAIDQPVIKGQFDHLMHAMNARIQFSHGGQSDSEEFYIAEHSDKFDVALEQLTHLLEKLFPAIQVVIVGHRVVQGGDKYFRPVVVNDEVLEDLTHYIPLAPLHQPHNIDGIKIFSRFFSQAKQVALFDTAFHQHLPDVEKTFAIPLALTQQGIRRYGFHGLSYQYLCQALTQLTPAITKKSILIHLGNGASMCACVDRQSVATSMGFSTLDGLMMGTRSGAIDPGVLLYLLKKQWSLEQLEALLYQDSGLKGVSGISSDMQMLRNSDAAEASFAITLFTYQIVKYIGMLAAVLNGVDMVVFTGGIGEHDAQLRLAVTEQLTYLGLRIDQDKNSHANGLYPEKISTHDSPIEIWVIATDEEFIVAQESLNLYV